MTNTTTRMPVKCSTIDAADRLVAHFNGDGTGTEIQLTPVEGAPTRFVAIGTPAALLNLLFLVSANGWVTDRSALDASLNLLASVVR